METKNASRFISLKVLDLQNRQEVGYVLDICFDDSLKKLVGFIVADEESERENFLPIKDVKVFGQDCLFIDDAFSTQLSYDMPSNNPIGKMVYDDKGCLLGKVKEVSIDKTGGRLQLESCELPSSRICCNGNNYLVFGKKIRKNNIKSAKFNTSNVDLPKVEVQSVASAINAKIGGRTQGRVESPSKITLTPTALLNKMAAEDIYGLNNEIIIKKGQIINQKILEKAKKHGKINLLIINSK